MVDNIRVNQWGSQAFVTDEAPDTQKSGDNKGSGDWGTGGGTSLPVD